MERVGVIGLGYVGLPVAVAFAAKFEGTVGFDIASRRVAQLREGNDITGEVGDAALAASSLEITDDPEALRSCTFFVVAVPTPIDGSRKPDLSAMRGATRTVAKVLKRGDVVVYESTVYPGVTEEICGPLLEELTGLVCGTDFFLGYSPERINPGDPVHRLETIVKVVAGQDAETLERVATTYERIVDAGVHRAPTIQVAEAAKVIENTQRDLNIAFMNELAVIFDRLGIRTADVLAAARTKWNFLPFTPGLVGGHCIGVDPYYLTARAEAAGYHPEVILAGRRINDGMSRFVVMQVVKALNKQGLAASQARVGVLGLTFKENVPDIRNSKVPDIVAELREFGATVLCHDPLADASETAHEQGIEMSDLDDLRDLDALVLAVPHAAYLELPLRSLASRVKPNGVVHDVRSALPHDAPELASLIVLSL